MRDSGTTYEIGTMQGRLLPKYKGRYQAHPVGYWQDEFPLASQYGLQLIEFIFDYAEADRNPLSTDAGVDSILELVAKTGVSVRTICADYFMEAPLHRPGPSGESSLRVLVSLLDRAQRLGVKDIVIPCVDQSTLATSADRQRFIGSIREVLSEVAKRNIRLSLETDLAPVAFAKLLEEIASPFVTVNYDIGNSASLGFDPAEEFAAYGHAISDIHIKDRKRDGGSVALGTGNANFARVFSSLAKINYSGPFIMQAYRDDEGRAIFQSQLAWIRPWLEDWAFASNAGGNR